MKHNIFLLSLVVISMIFNSCLKQQFENPPLYQDANLPVNQTILGLKQWYASQAPNFEPVTVTEDWVIYGVVTSSDKSGNIYKQMYIQDSTAGICLSIDMTNTNTQYPLGRKVYIKLKGLTLGTYGKLVQIGYEIDKTYQPSGVFRMPTTIVDKHIFKGGMVGMPQPIEITSFAQLTDLYQSMYVKLMNVEISDADLGQTYADAVAALTKNRTLKNCAGQSIFLRNSGYANFAGILMPKGKGDVTGIYTRYNADNQFLINDTTDMASLTNTRCDGSNPNANYILDEGFSSLSGWLAISVAGAEVWSIASYGMPAPCAKMSGYNQGNLVNEDWLISKELDLTSYTKVSLSFLSASKYSGNPLELYVSSNYIGGSALPFSASWTKINATFDQAGNFSFSPSGNVDLTSYAGQKIRLGFKYTSTSSAATTWELDNIKVAVE